MQVMSPEVKIKKGRLSCVIVAVVAFLCLLVFYLNAAVLCLNIDVAILAPRGCGTYPKIMVILVQQAGNLPSTRSGAFCTLPS